MSIKNFKNPWAEGGEFHPDWLGGEKVLENDQTEFTTFQPKRTSKWAGTPAEVKKLEEKYPKFTEILKNLNKLPALYPNLIDELHKCTGMSKKQHIIDLNYNAGAQIFVFEFTMFDATASNSTSFTLNSIALDNFEMLEGEELKVGSAMWIITLIHEEVHRGDRFTNDEKISGQWDCRKIIGRDKDNEEIYEYSLDFPDNIPFG